MKTLHYYITAFAVTAVFFGLMVLVSARQPMSAPSGVLGYQQNPMHNNNDASDPAARALAIDRTGQQNEDLAQADPVSAPGPERQPK